MASERTDLYAMREALAARYLDILTNGEILMVKGEPVLDGEGRPIRVAPTASMMAAITKFLKDNGIQKDPPPKDITPRPAIADRLPFPAEEGKLALPEE